MKLLVAFMVVCVFIGTRYERRQPKYYLLPVIGISILLTIGYYVFRPA
jgi:uncharacterized membrane protein YfcA